MKILNPHGSGLEGASLEKIAALASVLALLLGGCQPDRASHPQHVPKPAPAARQVVPTGQGASGTAKALDPPASQIGPAPGVAPVPVPPPAPWQAPALSIAQVDPVSVRVWKQAANRRHCALLAPTKASPVRDGASIRPAHFAGGWAVAYDRPARQPTQRSSFGVAGSGATAEYSYVWPEYRHYADGSVVGLGPEGGQGPKWLAYLTLPGQQCLYNIWSMQGRAHLLHLLEALRVVQTVD